MTRPLALRPPDLRRPSVSFLFRLGGGQLLAQRVGREAAPRAGRLGFAIRHLSAPTAVSAPSNSSIRSPGASWTIAFFQARVRPAWRPRRFGLERTLEVRTCATSTPKISCDGLGDLGLVGAVVDPEGVLALGDQRVALLRDHRADEDVARVHQPSLSSQRRASARFGDDERGGADHVGDAGGADLERRWVARDVAEALHRAGLLGGEDDQGRALGAPFRQRRGRLLGRRGLEGRGVEDGDAAALGVDRERRAHRPAAGFAVDLDRVVARLGAEGDAAAEAAGDAEGADAGAAGALLAPGLGGGEGDLAASQGRGGAAAARGQVGAGGLVDQRLVEGLGEELFGQVGFGRLAEHGRLRPSVLTSTIALREPGTEPLIRSRLRSASTSAISRPFWVIALVAHLARHPHALEDAGGEGAGADRAGGADVVRAVADRAAAEVVALDPALEALADRDAGDLDLLARLEARDGDVVADLGALLGAEILVAELDQVAHRRRAGLLQVAYLGLAQLALLDLAEGELHGGVAVALAVADRGDLAGAGLDHGDRHDGAVLAEDLGHARASCRGSRPWLRGGSRCRRRPAASPGAAASRRFSATAGGCRSAACGCGSRSARASPCP